MQKRSIGPWKIVLWIVLAILLLVAAFYGLGGWHFSNEINSQVFEVHPPEAPEFDITLDQVESEAVVLRADPDATNLTEDGLFGLLTESEATLIDGIISAETSEGVSTVRRSRIPDEPIPAPDSAVRLDAFVWPGDPQTALGLAFEEIELEIEGGQAGAWYLEGASDTWMIFVHGKGAPRNEALRLLPLAVERGYHALVIDYRNDPGVPRDPSGKYQYGLTEWNDVAAAARHAKTSGGQDIIVVGYSMGGSNVMSYLLESPLRNQTVAAILDSPALNVEAAVDHAAERETLPLTSIALPQSLISTAKWLAGWRFDIDWEELNYVERWRDLHTPTLIIQGTSDETVPVEPAAELARIRPELVTLVTPPGVGHVLAWNADPEGYEALVNAFLDDLGV
ncbi:MAG: alpha/beta hydrolase [Actinomycetota bacterium]|nr:alpha/beta hydrolase [Actinomycetota bacterium]